MSKRRRHRCKVCRKRYGKRTQGLPHGLCSRECFTVAKVNAALCLPEVKVTNFDILNKAKLRLEDLLSQTLTPAQSSAFIKLLVSSVDK